MNASSSSGTAWCAAGAPEYPEQGGRAAWPFEPLRPLSYGAIIADPPWAYEMRSANGYAKSPEAHYATMTEAEIAALPVGHLAGRDCLLFLWSTWPHLPVAMRVMAAWGFTYRTGGSWTKLTRSGKRAFGTGYIFCSATEPFLIGTIGEPAYRSKSIRNLIESERREHSRKPPEARAMIEKLLPDVFACELFAREPWPGHHVWGNEACRFLTAEPGPAHRGLHRGAMGREIARKVRTRFGQEARALHDMGQDGGGEPRIGGRTLFDKPLDGAQVDHKSLACGSGGDGCPNAARLVTGKGRNGNEAQDKDGGQTAHEHKSSGPER